LLVAGSLALAGPVRGQAAFSEKKKLYDLLEKRKKKFDHYLSSLDRKSGLFGSRTKNDIRNSMDVLKDIVETDNQIIAVLNRAVDFKVFEKSKMNYDLLERDQELERLRGDVATLRARVQRHAAEEVSRSRVVRFQWLILAAMLALLAITWYRHMRK
jgi:hypothetical protein